MASEVDNACIDAGVSWTGAASAADGDYYLAGWFGGTVDLDPSAGTDIRTPPSFVGQNFLSKYDADGKYLWSTILPLRPRGLTVAPSGELVFGSVSDEGKSFGKLSADGELLWQRTFAAVLTPSMSEAGLSAVRTDASGNIYVAGNFQGELDLDPGPGTLKVASDQFTGFIASFTSAGDLRWGRALTAESQCVSNISSFTLHDKQLVSVGSFLGTCTLGAGGANETQPVAGSWGAAFIERGDLEGHVEPALILNSTGLTPIAPPQRVQATSVAVAADATYVGGSFVGEVDFDPGKGLSLRGSAARRPFVLKLTPEGALAWVRSIRGGSALTLAPGGGVLAVGQSLEELQFQDGSVGWDIGPPLLTALNADGSAAWTVEAHVGDELKIALLNSEKLILLGSADHGCVSPITRFAWPH